MDPSPFLSPPLPPPLKGGRRGRRSIHRYRTWLCKHQENTSGITDTPLQQRGFKWQLPLLCRLRENPNVAPDCEPELPHRRRHEHTWVLHPHWPEQPDPSYGIVIVPFAALPNVAFGMTAASAVFFHKVLPKPKAASEFGGCRDFNRGGTTGPGS